MIGITIKLEHKKKRDSPRVKTQCFVCARCASMTGHVVEPKFTINLSTPSMLGSFGGNCFPQTRTSIAVAGALLALVGLSQTLTHENAENAVNPATVQSSRIPFFFSKLKQGDLVVCFHLFHDAFFSQLSSPCLHTDRQSRLALSTHLEAAASRFSQFNLSYLRPHQ